MTKVYTFTFRLVANKELTLVIATELIVRPLFSGRHTGDPDVETFSEKIKCY